MDELQLAGCILLNDKGQILLIHRQTDKYDHWEVPGGKVEAGESDEVAAIRELQEELGVQVRIDRKLGDATFVDGQTMHYHWFSAVTDGTPCVCEPDKFTELAYFAPDELSDPSLSLSEGAKQFVTLMKSGEIRL
jgi:8-oxo-dGTP pyrophosphatase MutT (NUDIX family)